jgi:hypothetical protein
MSFKMMLPVQSQSAVRGIMPRDEYKLHGPGTREWTSALNTSYNTSTYGEDLFNVFQRNIVVGFV